MLMIGHNGIKCNNNLRIKYDLVKVFEQVREDLEGWRTGYNG
jgi:hypothetical protein